MSSKYEIEVLLRPAVEIYGAIVCFSMAFVIWRLPDMLFLPVSIAQGCAVILLLMGLNDLRSAIKVWRYRAGMTRTPLFTMNMAKIPRIRKKHYIGRGFRWTQQQTQRLSDTYESRYQPYIKMADSYDNHYTFRRIAEQLPLFGALSNIDSVFNPMRPPSEAGGNPALHGVGGQERDIHIPDKAREGNTLTLGTTGAGKTRAMEVFITQDIHHKDNKVVIVIDPKGDGDLLRRMYVEARRAGREREFQVFHLGLPQHSVRYNTIGNYSRITEIATRTADQLPDQGNAASFKEFAWRFCNLSARVLNEMGERPGLTEIRRAIEDLEPLFLRYYKHYLKTNERKDLEIRLAELRDVYPDEDSMPRNFVGRTIEGFRYYKLYEENRDTIEDPLIADLSTCIKYDKTYYDKLISSIGPLLEKLTSGMSGKLLTPDYMDVTDDRGIMDWRSVIRRRGIVYVGLDALTDSTVSSAVGQSMLSDLTSIAGEIYKYGAFAGTPDSANQESPDIVLHFDEVNELIGNQFIPMVNKCRGAHMVVNAYTQASHDIEVGIGSAPKAEVILANFANTIMMRVRNKETAEYLCNQLPDVNVNQVIAVTGATDSDYLSGSHFTSRNEDRTTSVKVRMLEVSSLMNLPNGQAFAMMEGGRLYKLRFPMPAKEEFELPDDLEKIIEEMNNQVVTNQWSEELPWWKPVEAAA